MIALHLAPAVLSLVLLAAHFLRDGGTLLVAGVLALIPLLTVRRRWVSRLFQLVLLLAAAEWLRTLFELRELRIALGRPHTRMSAILIGVAAFTALSALVFETRRLRQRYRTPESRAPRTPDA